MFSAASFSRASASVILDTGISTIEYTYYHNVTLITNKMYGILQALTFYSRHLRITVFSRLESKLRAPINGMSRLITGKEHN